MASTAETRYQGKEGEAYAATVLATDDTLQQVMAQERTRKLQAYVSREDTVLEIGVGIGTNLRNLNCSRRVGYDVGDYGRLDCQRQGIEFTDDLNSLEGSRFSVVLLHHSLEHTPGPQAILQKAGEYLDEGGRLLVFVPSERRDKYREVEPNHHLYSWTPQTLGNLVKSAGYVVDSVRLRPFGYERRLASLGRYGMGVYRATLFAVRLLRPVYEVVLVAHKQRNE